jgi:hypothetical protein
MVTANREQQDGHALLLALFVLLIISAALALVAAAIQLENRTVREVSRETHVAVLADAALAETLAELAQSTSFPGVREHSLGSGHISSSVETISFDRALVRAVGRYAGKRRVIEAEVYLLKPLGPKVLTWRRLPGAEAPP